MLSPPEIRACFFSTYSINIFTSKVLLIPFGQFLNLLVNSCSQGGNLNSSGLTNRAQYPPSPPLLLPVCPRISSAVSLTIQSVNKRWSSACWFSISKWLQISRIIHLVYLPPAIDSATTSLCPPLLRMWTLYVRAAPARHQRDHQWETHFKKSVDLFYTAHGRVSSRGGSLSRTLPLCCCSAPL